MPSLRMKTKLSMGPSRGKHGLRVCQKSCMVSKRPSSHFSVSTLEAEFDTCFQDCHGDASHMELLQEFQTDESTDQPVTFGGDSELERQQPVFVDNSLDGRLEHTCSPDLGTIFSPALEPTDAHNEPDVENDGGDFDRSSLGDNEGAEMPALGVEEIDDNKSLSNGQTCNISDFFISDMIIASIPFEGNAVDGNITENNFFPDYKCPEPSMLFDVANECMILPYLEETVKSSDLHDLKSCEEVMIEENNNTSFYLAVERRRSCNQESDANDLDQVEDFDPHSFIKSLPELSDVVSSFQPTMVPKGSQSRKEVTLVLDLDETLVHSTLEHRDDADFTFTVFFNMKEHTVYVKQRPYLHTFLERVAELFEVVVFTASQSIYAEQLLDILDPDGKLISRRVYREACIFSDEGYTKDLTVFGIDLAKVAIIDNSPQVFRLQINNGIPISSWFDDPSDCALISLLPFLETLVDVEDVRPIIAKRFGHMRKFLNNLPMAKVIGTQSFCCTSANPWNINCTAFLCRYFHRSFWFFYPPPIQSCISDATTRSIDVNKRI